MAVLVAVLNTFLLLLVVVKVGVTVVVGRRVVLGTLEKAEEVRVVPPAPRGRLEPGRISRRMLDRETLLLEKAVVREQNRPPGASALVAKEAVGRTLKKASLLPRASTLRGVPECPALNLVPECRALRAVAPPQSTVGKA